MADRGKVDSPTVKPFPYQVAGHLAQGEFILSIANSYIINVDVDIIFITDGAMQPDLVENGI